MSITLNNDNANTEINTAEALKTAALQKNQQELEGEMELKLIGSANIDTVSSPVGNSGHNINIKV